MPLRQRIQGDCGYPIGSELIFGHEDRVQGPVVICISGDFELLTRPQFSNLLGTVYCRGNLVFTPDGTCLLSPVGNRVTVFDLIKYVGRRMLSSLLKVTLLILYC